MKPKAISLNYGEGGYKAEYASPRLGNGGRRLYRRAKHTFFAVKALDDKIMRYTGIKDIMG